VDLKAGQIVTVDWRQEPCDSTQDPQPPEPNKCLDPQPGSKVDDRRAAFLPEQIALGPKAVKPLEAVLIAAPQWHHAAFQNTETAHGVCFTAETTSGVQSLNGFTTATPASRKWR
jgi:hypothetical protein